MTRTIVRIQGGLGNQLFQLAHALTLQMAGADTRLDLSWFGRHGEAAGRALEIEPLTVDLRTVPSFEADVITAALRNRSRRRGPGDHVDRLGPWEIHSGYWQDAAAVDRARPRLEPLLQAAGRTPSPIEPHARYIAVHVRLGDYLDPATRAFHGLTRVDEQQTIAEQVRRELGVPTIRVFTDSPDALDTVAIGSDVEVADASTAWDALLGLAGGSGLVMSNSSLSWWAATLAEWRGLDPTRVWMPRPWLAEPSGLDERLASPTWGSYSRVID